MAIDILAGIILLFFFLKGWHRGALLSLLGVLRVVVCYGIAYFSGRYLGYWIGEATQHPRLVTIPAVAIFTFALIAFVFHIVMHNIHARHKKKENEKNFQRPLPSCMVGGAINLAAGTFSLAFLFWLGSLFLLGIAGQAIPGVDRSCFGRFARRTAYEIAYASIPKKGRESQVAAMSRMISNPAKGMGHLKNVVASDSIQQVLSDPEFGKALLSGDASQIQANASFQQLAKDQATLNELRELGIVSGQETQSGRLCKKLAAFGQNEKIRYSIENLQAKQLLSTGNILVLIRDPDFDAIIAELAK